jgi:hypothetical protein
MTWTLKLRGDPTGTIAHEYLCPDHGRFTADVPRADVPDEMFCAVRYTDGKSWGPAQKVNICGLASPWSPSGITSRVKAGEVVRGKVETSGLPADVCMSTEALADGMPLHEFKAKRAKVHADLAVRKMRALTGRGGKVMR